MIENKKDSMASSEPGGGKTVLTGDATLSINSILRSILDVKNGIRTAEDVAHAFVNADEKEINKISVRSKDDTYLFAVKRGDMETARRMVTNCVTEQINTGNLLDAHIKKAPMWFTTRGLQLPKVVQTIIHANSSIFDSSEKSNRNFAYGQQSFL